MLPTGKPKKPKQIFCHLTGKREDLERHLDRFCKFYAGQDYKPTLGNSACHEICTVPSRFKIPGLAKPDED